MVTEGKIERTRAIEILQQWLEERRSDDDDNDGPGYVASALLDLGATEARHELLEAWEAQRCLPMWQRKEVQEVLRESGSGMTQFNK